MGFITENAAMLNQSWSILKAVLDFSLIFLLVYVILYFLRGTRAVYILVGIVIFLIAAIILIQYMQLEVLGWLLQNLWPVLATAVVIVFQPELRRALALLGTTVSVYRKQEQSEAIEEVVKAVQTIAGKYQMQLELKELDDFRQAPEDAGAVMFRSVTPEVEAFLAASTIPATVWTGKKLPVRQDMLLSYHDSFNIGASGAELLLDMISGKRPAQNILIDSCGTEYYQNKFADYTLDF